MSSPDRGSATGLPKPGSDKGSANSLPKPPSDPGPPKSPGSDASGSSAATRRSQFGRQGSGLTNTPSRGRLERGVSRDGSVRRRTYRRMSSFDLPHTNSLPSVPDITRLESINLKEVPWWTSQRFLLAIISFFGFLVLYAQRVNLSIAIVSMVDHGLPTSEDGNHTATNGSISYRTNGTGNTTINVLLDTTTAAGSDEEDRCPELQKSAVAGEFHWDKPMQGLLLGAFFYGYLILQVVGGRVSEKFGAKRVIALGMFPVAILNIVSPPAARASPWLFLVVRVFVGLGEGVMYPAAQALWARWAPPNERSRLIGFSYAGGQFGNALIFPIGGFLCAYGFDGGWASVFYVIGICGFVWCVVWMVFVTDSPEQNKRISDIEKKYIQYSIGERAKGRKGSTPWRAILTSRGMWAIIVGHMCGNYGAYMLLTQIPSYMKEVLKFDIKSNGVFSMLPYLMFWFFITVSGTLADLLISREILSVAWTRKLMSCIGTIGPACFLIGTGFMECHQQTGAVVMLTFAVGLCGFHFSGYFINHGDIAPAYAGTMFGISNTAATVPGILAPYVVAALTPNGKREEWQVAFYVAAAVYCFGAAFYLIFGQGEIQPWAEADVEDTKAAKEGDEAGVGFDLHEIHETVHEEEEEEDEEDKAAEKMLRTVNGENKQETDPV